MPQKRFCACVGREADAITGDISEADALLQSKFCLLLFYTFLAGVIPDFAGFLAVLFVRDS